jgi:hypothetical protein
MSVSLKVNISHLKNDKSSRIICLLIGRDVAKEIHMELSTTIIWFAAIHVLVAFFVSLSVFSCPFRFGTEKFGLFLLTWLVPLLGSIFVHQHIGTLSIKNSNSPNGTTSVDIPPSSENCEGSGNSGSCSGGD